MQTVISDHDFFLNTLHIFQFKTLYHTDEILVIKRREFLMYISM